jgi:cardiolipin synthase (CMP-forming)
VNSALPGAERTWTLPNLLTSLRIVLVGPIGLMIWQGNYRWALVIALVSAATDGLDGWIARRYSLQSRLGSFLDPAADKLTALVAFYVLSLKGEIPAYLFAIAILRDACLAAGFFSLYMRRAQLVPLPLWIGRIATFTQFLLIFYILLRFDLPGRWPGLRAPLYHLCAVALLASFLIYTARALRMRRE